MIDCHFHFDGSLVSVNGLIASMDQCGVEQMVLIPKMIPPIYMTAAMKLGLPWMRRMIHRNRGMIHNAGLKLYNSQAIDGKSVDMLGDKIEVYPEPDNKEVMEVVAAHPGRFRAWVFVNPAGKVDPLEEVKRCQARGKIIGVKAHPFWHKYATKRLMPVAEFCQDQGLPMLIHQGAFEGGDFKLLARSFPKLRIIYAHAGVPYGPAVWELAAKSDAVFVDLSSPYVDARIAGKAIQKAGPRKCMFGTDGPYFHSANDRFDFTPAIRMIDQLNLSPADRERVMGGNFREIIGT